jgi:cytochrome b6-f complex iron-sulfur subunit
LSAGNDPSLRRREFTPGREPQSQEGLGGTAMSKERARSGLTRLQALIGVILLVAAGAGVYLLATDLSLWLLALSHAVGLIVIVGMDIVLALLNLSAYRRAYLPTMAAAFLAVVLQLGDIATAPQYSMTIQHFASYLFGLWAFDLLLALQVVVLAIGLAGRPYAQYLARRKTRRGRELNYTRRGFVRSMLAFAGLLGVAVVLSSIKLPVPSNQPQSTTTTTEAGVPAGAIAKVSSLKVGTPVYFDYPAGYPNMLTLGSDGTLTAVSLLCTHVCCQCEYVQSSNVIACPCHGSLFDPSGKLLRGPAYSDLPVIQLRTDSNGYIFPTGVNNPGPCQV